MKNNKKKSNHNIQIEDVDSYLNTNKETGLTQEEVLIRRQKFGTNVLVKAKKEPFIISFLKTLIFEPMSLLLFITGLIGLALAIYENVRGSSHYVLSYIEAGVLLSIDIINGLFGTIQERKSSNAIEELEKMSSPLTNVLRDGKIKQIPSSEVVIGDVIIVEAGNAVSADAILFSDAHLRVSEAVLTGESEAILKDADHVSSPNDPLGEQKNKIFAGTNVLNGKGYGIVYQIGNKTEIGKIANLLNNSKNMLSPLQLKMQQLGKILGIFGIVLTLITFLFSLFAIENVFGSKDIINSVQSSLLLAISLAAIAIPEGLTAIVTIVLSIGVKNMTKKNALIKKLPSVETLGSTSVICSDKTGTLTINKMTIVKLWTLNSSNESSNVEEIDEFKKEMLIKSSLCTDGVVDETKEVALRKNPIGDPTEIAILEATLNSGISILNLKNKYKRLAEIPFDSDRKLMSTINKIDNKNILIVKGAPDVILSRCKNIDVDKIMNINNKWSDNAIRVLAVAQKEITEEFGEDLDPNKFENNLEFIGLIGMVDPPREGIKFSIQECISAGIKPIMITGDHLNTAKAIAKDLGIIRNEQKELAITGAELDQMNDKELLENIEKYSVYARVNPENKIRIVQAWQKKDQVVAMTGDGVNDAPALKAADIGCAMGITGTDVSKQAADMILMDDNFSTIVEAVKLGRNIYENIRRITKFLLSSNVTGIFSIVFGMILFYLLFEIGGWGKISANDIIGISGISSTQAEQLANEFNSEIKFQTTITTILILVHHMVIETFPGVALGTQSPTSNLMNRRPISKYESIFARGMIGQLMWIGLLHGILTIVAFILGYWIAIITNAPLLRFYYGIIATFLTLTIGGVLKSITMCSSSFVWKQKWKECKWIYITSTISILIIFIIVIFPQITSISAQMPELGDIDINKIDGLTQGQLETIFKQLSDNKDNNSYANYLVYLVGIILGILTFVILEAMKYFNKTFFKEDKIKITEFELIKRPHIFSFKEKFRHRERLTKNV